MRDSVREKKKREKGSEMLHLERTDRCDFPEDERVKDLLKTERGSWREQEKQQEE